MAVRPATREWGLTGTVADCVLSGELDLATDNQTRRICRRAMTGGPNLAIDVTEVTFIDCAGLAPLLEVVRDVRATGGRVSLLGAGSAVRRLLSLIGLWDLFEMPPVTGRVEAPTRPGQAGALTVSGMPGRGDQQLAARTAEPGRAGESPVGQGRARFPAVGSGSGPG